MKSALEAYLGLSKPLTLLIQLDRSGDSLGPLTSPEVSVPNGKSPISQSLEARVVLNPALDPLILVQEG